jgi:hypothetical protein
MSRFSSSLALRAKQHINALVMPIVGIAAVTILTDSALSVVRYINGKVESKTVASVSLADLGLSPVSRFSPFVWCFDEAPAFAFVRGQNVMTKTFGGPLQEVMSLDSQLSSKSLECSDDGAVTTIFSRDGSEFYIRSGSKLGRYKKPMYSPLGFVRTGHMLSPNGMMIAAPFDFTFVSGDNVLGAMRVMKIEGDSFSWRRDELLYFDTAKSSVRSYNLNTDRVSTLINIRERYGANQRIHNVVNCGKYSLISLSSEASGRADGSKLKSRIIRINPISDIISEAGETSSIVVNGHSNSLCMISRASDSGGWETIKYEFLFDDGLVKYETPIGVDFGYDVAVAPHHCLVMGGHYVFGGKASVDSTIVAIRMTRSGRCGSK